MPRPPLLMHLAVWSQLLPPVMVATRRARGVRARVWTALAMLASVGGDTAQLLIGRQGINNLWVGYISTAVTGILVVGALANWQVTARARRLMYFALALYVAVFLMTSALDDPQHFSLLAIPAHSIMVLLLSLWTLITNALEPREQALTRHDWFWACLGFALLYGASSAVQPLLRMLLAEGKLADMMSVLYFKAGLQIAAMLLITVGMLCPVQAPSGPSSSPAR